MDWGSLNPLSNKNRTLRCDDMPGTEPRYLTLLFDCRQIRIEAMAVFA